MAVWWSLVLSLISAHLSVLRVSALSFPSEPFMPSRSPIAERRLDRRPRPASATYIRSLAHALQSQNQPGCAGPPSPSASFAPHNPETPLLQPATLFLSSPIPLQCPFLRRTCRQTPPSARAPPSIPHTLAPILLACLR